MSTTEGEPRPSARRNSGGSRAASDRLNALSGRARRRRARYGAVVAAVAVALSFAGVTAAEAVRTTDRGTCGSRTRGRARRGPRAPVDSTCCRAERPASGGRTVTLKYFYNGACGSFARIENAPRNCWVVLDRSTDGGRTWTWVMETVDPGIDFAYTMMGNNLSGRVSEGRLSAASSTSGRTCSSGPTGTEPDPRRPVAVAVTGQRCELALEVGAAGEVVVVAGADRVEVRAASRQRTTASGPDRERAGSWTPRLAAPGGSSGAVTRAATGLDRLSGR